MILPIATIDILTDKICLIRGQRVILDSDLAQLYGVTTKRFNEQVRRNQDRFPSDFMFQLVADELEVLRSQNATSKPNHGGRRYLPFAFTEHGAIMAASVLNSPLAVEMSVFVVRAFIQLRALLANHQEWTDRLDELDRKFSAHDQTIGNLIDTLRHLTHAPTKLNRPIGFTADFSQTQNT